MANENDNLTGVFDLDSKEGLDKILQLQREIDTLKGKLEGINETSKNDGLEKQLKSVLKLTAIVTGTLAAMKATLDTVFAAEELKQINRQFELMTQNSGIATETLKRGLIEASKGLVDDTDLMRAANRALVELNGDAAKFPEIMEIARKSTAVFGGDAVTNFEAITHAIATGSTKALKNLGLTIDVDEANKKYAKTLGVTADQLSEAGKQQALLNAVLEKGATAFKDVDESVMKVTNTWALLKATLKETKDIFVLLFDKIAGPPMQFFLEAAAKGGKDWNSVFKYVFGSPAEKAAARVEYLTRQVSSLNEEMTRHEKNKEKHEKDGWLGGAAASQKRIDELKEKIQSVNAEMSKYEDTSKKAAVAQDKVLGGGGSAPKADLVDRKKIAEEEAKFQRDILKLKEDRVRDEMKITKSLTEFESLQEKQKRLFKQETNEKIKEIANRENLTERQRAELITATRQDSEAKLREMDMQGLERKRNIYRQQMQMVDEYSQYEELRAQDVEILKQQFEMQRQQVEMDKSLNEEQKRMAQLEIERQYQLEVTQIMDQAEMDREQITDRWVRHGSNAAEQWARGFASGSMKAQASLRNFGQQGQFVFNAFTQHASNAFMQLGEGGKKGSEILRGAVLGMIADIAQNYGQMLLAAGIWPPNPAALAAGAALLTLAGYLRSQARGKAQESGSFGGGSASGMGDIGGVPSSLAQSGLAADNQKVQKAFHFEVHGDILDSDSTRTRIAELVREAADATDFSIKRVGGTV